MTRFGLESCSHTTSSVNRGIISQYVAEKWVLLVGQVMEGNPVPLVFVNIQPLFLLVRSPQHKIQDDCSDNSDNIAIWVSLSMSFKLESADSPDDKPYPQLRVVTVFSFAIDQLWPDDIADVVENKYASCHETLLRGPRHITCSEGDD